MVKEEPEDEFEKSLLKIQNQLTAIRELPLQIQNHISLLEKQLSDLISHKIRSTETSKINEEDRQYDDAVEQENVEDESQETRYNDDVFETTVDEMIESLEEMEESNEKPEEKYDKEVEDKEPSGRPMYPLTPLPRPIILPGGRKWRGPKDAYNEKFIAETLISQAEVLVGSTLG